MPNKFSGPSAYMSFLKLKFSIIQTSNTNYLQNERLKRIMSVANEDPSFADGLFY